MSAAKSSEAMGATPAETKPATPKQGSTVSAGGKIQMVATAPIQNRYWRLKPGQRFDCDTDRAALYQKEGAAITAERYDAARAAQKEAKQAAQSKQTTSI